jgi:predicted component of type VI protein secretion system
MSMIAHLKVTAGPDAGREFVIEEELVHIGRGEENHFRLQDDSLAEHQASIAHRTGRFAIYSPVAHAASVDGSELPAEKWVWLPASATIRLGSSTQVRFAAEPAAIQNGGEASAASSSDTSRDAAVNPSAETVRKSARRKGAKSASGRSVAKFITDRPGVPLVKLGEDGKLPELRLADSHQQANRRSDTKSKSPLLIYGVLGFSFVLSLGMLLVEPGSSAISSSEKDEVRQGLVEFFGDEGATLEPYQELLRRAYVAHSRGDYDVERAAYQRVLAMLNSADIRDPSNLNGLTGQDTGRGRASDQELRRHLQLLLAR